MKKYIIYGMAFVLAACSSNDQKEKTPEPAQVALTKSANSDAFNQSFGKLLDNYYALKDDFVAEKKAQVDSAAAIMLVSVDSLQLQELKADTNIVATAKTYTDGISSELKGLIGEKDIEAKRKSFQMVGDQLYDLIRTVQYDRAVVYHQFCPMAFNDQGANWLSNSPDIRNPYIPKKMLHCGEVKDSIDFRQKK
ncbi:MAG: Co/Zn/Cd efflux system rane fusion protein [Sediminibacterium sp.]|nr:Co/Zn/Cd efflux system rane fusion protein [Sediminibacterium sp.]